MFKTDKIKNQVTR